MLILTFKNVYAHLQKTLDIVYDSSQEFLNGELPLAFHFQAISLFQRISNHLHPSPPYDMSLKSNVIDLIEIVNEKDQCSLDKNFFFLFKVFPFCIIEEICLLEWENFYQKCLFAISSAILIQKYQHQLYNIATFNFLVLVLWIRYISEQIYKFKRKLNEKLNRNKFKYREIQIMFLFL